MPLVDAASKLNASPSLETRHTRVSGGASRSTLHGRSRDFLINTRLSLTPSVLLVRKAVAPPFTTSRAVPPHSVSLRGLAALSHGPGVARSQSRLARPWFARLPQSYGRCRHSDPALGIDAARQVTFSRDQCLECISHRCISLSQVVSLKRGSLDRFQAVYALFTVNCPILQPVTVDVE